MQKEMFEYQETEMMNRLESSEVVETMKLEVVSEIEDHEADLFSNHSGRAIYDFYK